MLIDKLIRVLKELDRGADIKCKSGHTIALASTGEPGFMQFDEQRNPTGVLFQVGSEVSWMWLINEVREMKESDIKKIEDQP